MPESPAVICRKCGAGSPAGGDQCPRCGAALPGNSLARQSGAYAVQQPADLRQSVADMTGGIIADRGGESELTTLERAYVSKLGDVEITLRLMAADIAAKGLITPAGGVRSIFSVFLQAIDRWDRLAQRIGIARRQKKIPSLDEYVAARYGPPAGDQNGGQP